MQEKGTAVPAATLFGRLLRALRKRARNSTSPTLREFSDDELESVVGGAAELLLPDYRLFALPMLALSDRVLSDEELEWVRGCTNRKLPSGKGFPPSPAVRFGNQLRDVRERAGLQQATGYDPAWLAEINQREEVKTALAQAQPETHVEYVKDQMGDGSLVK